MTDLGYIYWLATAPGITGAGAAGLERRYGARYLWEADDVCLKSITNLPSEHINIFIRSKNEDRIMEEIHNLSKRGIWVIGIGCEGYPELLAKIPDPPIMLYGMGRMPPEALPKTAIIGARRCSGYGIRVTKKLAEGLAESGFVIVSGMAAGIDSHAHQTAMDVYAGADVLSGAPSPVVAVLGCGVDICYPKSNEHLYRRLIKDGCVVSEYAPGTKPGPALTNQCRYPVL